MEKNGIYPAAGKEESIMTQAVKIFQAYKYGLHKDSTGNPVIRNHIMSNCGCARKVYYYLTDDLYAFLEEHVQATGSNDIQKA